MPLGTRRFGMSGFTPKAVRLTLLVKGRLKRIGRRFITSPDVS
jgi:hypothetical protein